jgi:hypothetical protein
MIKVPITCQVLEVTNISSSSAVSSTPAHVEAKLSDRKHYSGVVLSNKLHFLVSSKQLYQGVLVQMTNYISDLVDVAKNVFFCLDLIVVGISDTIFGSPYEYLSSALPSEVFNEFIVTDCDSFCIHCEQDPCDWLSLGRTIC